MAPLHTMPLQRSGLGCRAARGGGGGGGRGEWRPPARCRWNRHTSHRRDVSGQGTCNAPPPPPLQFSFSEPALVTPHPQRGGQPPPLPPPPSPSGGCSPQKAHTYVPLAVPPPPPPGVLLHPPKSGPSPPVCGPDFLGRLAQSIEQCIECQKDGTAGAGRRSATRVFTAPPPPPTCVPLRYMWGGGGAWTPPLPQALLLLLPSGPLSGTPPPRPHSEACAPPADHVAAGG